MPPTGPRVSRRRFLSTALGGAALGGGSALLLAPDGAPVAGRVSFHGRHQSGVTTPGQAHVIVAAFDTTATDRAALAAMFQALTSEVRGLMAGTVARDSNPLFPPSDNLIEGPEPSPADLSVTVAVGAGVFDARFGLSDRKPQQLRPMDRFPNDRIESNRRDGDLLLQVCAQTPDACNHALRRLMRRTRASLTLRWMMPGFQRPNTLRSGATSTRNLLGFKDGTANPDPAKVTEMRDLVWLSRGDDPAAWTTDGTYMVVRIIRNRVEFWDRTPLRTQELIIGRHKASGAPLGGVRETDSPDYAGDPEGRTIPLTAHIRQANPRDAEANRHRILRRGFSYSAGFGSNGQLDQGLLFVCFQRDLDAGFVAIQRRLDGEPLEEYITPVGGGYFFALPGVVDANDWLGRSLLSTA